MTLGKRLSFGALLALAFILVIVRLTVEVQFISVDGDDLPGWFVIERGNPNCGSEHAHLWGYSLWIPKGSFACTKDPIRAGAHFPLVWNRTTKHLIDRNDVRGSRSTYISQCKFSGEEFFVGSESNFAGSNDKTVLAIHRPDCSGTARVDGGS